MKAPKRLPFYHGAKVNLMVNSSNKIVSLSWLLDLLIMMRNVIQVIGANFNNVFFYKCSKKQDCFEE
jgi:hypothetical protein